MMVLGAKPVIATSRSAAKIARLAEYSVDLAIDTSREKQLEAVPDDAQVHALLGLSLAYLGRKAEAIRVAERAVGLLPTSRDAHLGPYIRHQLVRVYILVGESEKALDMLEPLLKIPYHLTPEWLGIDPDFDPLRHSSRFKNLLE